MTNNFGFPVVFSPQKMDSGASAARDYRRYAAGLWDDRARIPSDSPSVTPISALMEINKNKLLGLAREASQAGAPKGTPRQLVGDFYKSCLDQERLKTLGVSPLKDELALIDTVTDDASLARVCASLGNELGMTCYFGVGISPDPNSRDHYAMVVADSSIALNKEDYTSPQSEALRQAYLKRIASIFQLAGSTPEDAHATAGRILAMETRIAAKKLTPAEFRDPNKRMRRVSLAELRKLAPRLDFAAAYEEMGLPVPTEVVAVQLDSVVERGRIVADSSPEQMREYLRWALLNAASPYLGPEFRRVNLEFSRALYGPLEDSPIEKQALEQTTKLLGHPLSQLFVERYFSEQSRKDVENLVGQVRAEFRRRLEKNTWLTEPTRQYALKKLDALKVYVGYPDKWIDYSSVDVRPDDLVGNVFRINRFMNTRELAHYGGPILKDGFSQPGFTLPIDINAAYSSGDNQIEIPAAFLQPPFYDPKADIAVNLGAMAAVIGHEFTHGFDSQGRMFDAEGNLRDWWTPRDAAQFAAENEKLVAQANAFEILPGLKLNGAVESGENLADMGGVSLAFAVLQDYLAKHPEARAPIDGLTPEQRFFLAWSQLWAEKAQDGYYRQLVPSEAHPPGPYRQLAPHQHETGFYKAFKIGPNDPVWLEESKRAHIW